MTSRTSAATAAGRTSPNGTAAGATVGAGRVGEHLTLEPPRRGRRVRLPEVAVGVLVTVGFALAAVLWQLNAVRKEPVLALSAAVARGEVIEAADLRVVYVASDDPIPLLGRADAERVVGRVATADLPALTLLTDAHLADAAAVGAGEGVVGLSLEPGQFPSFGLRPGDAVNVVSAGAGDAAVATAAAVVGVEELDGQDGRFVSVKLPEDQANLVAATAERGPVRLVLVGRR